MPVPSNAGPDDGPGDHADSSKDDLRSEEDEAVVPVVPALEGDVDVPMASCFDRAVAFALPLPDDFVRAAEVVGDEDEEWVGGWYPPPENHDSQPDRIAQRRAPPDWSPNGRGSLTNALHMDVWCRTPL